MGIKDAIATLVGDIRYGQQPELSPKIAQDKFPLTQTVFLEHLRRHTREHILAGIDAAQRIMETAQNNLPPDKRFERDPGTLVVFFLAVPLTDQRAESLYDPNLLLAIDDTEIGDRFLEAAKNLTLSAFPQSLGKAPELADQAAQEIISWARAKKGSPEEKAKEANIAQIALNLNSLQTSSPESFR